MRVLCVGAAYPPRSCGGYELHSAGAVAHLRAHAHDVRVLTAGSSGAEPGEVVRDLCAFPARPRPVTRRRALAGEQRNADVLARHLAAFRPDAVCWWRLGELSVSLLARARMPAVAVVCDPWPVEAPARDPWARRRGLGVPAGAVERWLFASRWLREHLAARGFAPARTGLAPPGLEAGWLPPDPPPVAPRPWRGRLLYAGRLSPLKGVDVAVRALAHLPGDVTLRLVGEGEPRFVRALRRLAPAGRLDIVPAVPRESLRREYAAADAVLHPVVWEEPFGLVPLEAMALGTPVVATGTGGSGEYLRGGRNALLVPREDPAALAAAVRRLAGDPDLRDRLAAGGRETACAHPAERGHAAVREALEAVVAEARQAPRPQLAGQATVSASPAPLR